MFCVLSAIFMSHPADPSKKLFALPYGFRGLSSLRRAPRDVRPTILWGACRVRFLAIWTWSDARCFELGWLGSRMQVAFSAAPVRPPVA